MVNFHNLQPVKVQCIFLVREVRRQGCFDVVQSQLWVCKSMLSSTRQCDPKSGWMSEAKQGTRDGPQRPPHLMESSPSFSLISCEVSKEVHRFVFVQKVVSFLLSTVKNLLFYVSE